MAGSCNFLFRALLCRTLYSTRHLVFQILLDLENSSYPLITSIYKFCKHYDTTGSKESAYSTAGNPKYSPQAIRNMIRNTQKDAQSRRTPLKEIGQQNDGMSANTVSRHLKKMGIRSYKATRSTLAIPSQQEEEVCFCNAAQRLDNRRLEEGALDR